MAQTHPLVTLRLSRSLFFHTSFLELFLHFIGMPNPRTITLEELEQYFNIPEKQVAKNLGVCLTSLKKLCRHHGIHRWPYRKLKSIEKKIHRIRQNSSSFDDQSVAQSKLMVLVEEKQRFPFSGQPSGSYGGRRSNSSSSRSPDNDRQQPFNSCAPFTIPSTCYSSSISASDIIPGVCTSPHQLMLEQHYQQQSLQLQQQQQQQLIFDAFGSCESGSSEFSSCDEDMVGQPDDGYDPCLTYAPMHAQATVHENFFFQQEFSPAVVDTFHNGYSSYFESFAPFDNHFSSDAIVTC
jgi:hypothetical protein